MWLIVLLTTITFQCIVAENSGSGDDYNSRTDKSEYVNMSKSPTVCYF